MKTTYAICSLLLSGAFGWSTTISAQPAARDGAPQDTLFFNVSAAPFIAFAGPLDIVGGAGSVPGAVVEDKPYSADSITESAQILADGNRITQRNEARVFRDSDGRTRLEQTLGSVGAGAAANGPVTLISINDPVAEVSYTLEPKTQTARQFRPFKLAAGEMAWTAAALPTPGGDATASTEAMTDVRIAVRGAVTGPGPFNVPLPPGGGVAPVMTTPPLAAIHATTLSGPFASATEDLGDQIIEGVLAHGTRRTQTIEAGAIGNERAIEISTEQWYSDEIEAMVLRRHVDPRFGETVYRLVNVVRGEPSADLFTVPQGYDLQVESPPQIGLRRFNERLPPGGDQPGQRVFLAPPDAPESND